MVLDGRPLLDPVLVGGTGRSGTTLLARLLGRHPALFAFKWETQLLVSPRGIVDLIENGVDETRLDRFLDHLEGRWFRRVVRAGTPREYEAGLCDDVTDEELRDSVSRFRGRLTEGDQAAVVDACRDLMVDLARGAVDRAGAIRWAEKTPRNILYGQTLSELFPGMKLINIIRDGRDVAASMLANQFWPISASWDLPELKPCRGEITPDKAVLYWSIILDMARARAAALGAGQYLEIRFEDLATKPGETLANVCEFVGVPYAPEMVDGYDTSNHNIARWRRDLTAEQQAAVHEAFGERLMQEGYAV